LRSADYNQFVSEIDLDGSSANISWKPGKSEWLVLLFALGVCLVLNSITCRLYPAVWADEVSFSEPAINYAQHGGFVTRVWSYQPTDTFPAVNCPLYSMLLAAWLSIAGTSVLAARSLNYVLIDVAAFLVWLVSWRFKLVARPINRMTLVLLVEFGYGMSTAYRSSRPDMLGAVWMLLLALAFGVKQHRWRAWSLMFVSAAMVWTGLQVALAAAFACSLIWLLLRPFSVRDVIAVALGMMLGALLLVVFLARQEALSNFMVTVSSVTDQRAGMQHPASLPAAAWNLMQRSLHNFYDDFSIPPILAGAIFCLAIRRKRTGRSCTRPVWLLALLVVLAPFLLNAAGHFVIFYSYMIFLPGCLLFLSLFESLTQAGACKSRLLYPLFIGVVGLGLGLGLPLRLALAGLFCKIDGDRQIKNNLQARIHAADVVFTDFQMFIDARQFAGIVYVPDQFSAPSSQMFHKRELSAGQRASISLLIVKPEDVNSYTHWLGGQWATVGEAFGDSIQMGQITRWPVAGKKLAGYFSQAPNGRHPLQMLRREQTFSSAPAKD
jgi:hypothetical protein